MFFLLFTQSYTTMISIQKYHPGFAIRTKPHIRLQSMAKVVSSKPYAAKKPSPPKTNSPKKTESPVRTSPRKRANESVEPVKEPKVFKASQVKKTKKPQPPTFNEPKKASSPRKSPKKASVVEEEDREKEEVAMVEKEAIEEEVELRRRASIEAQQKLIISKLDFDSVASEEAIENSPVFVEETVSSEATEDEDFMEDSIQEDEENNPFFDHEKYLKSVENDDLGELYNAQFKRKSSTAALIKDRIRNYFSRREQSETSSNLSAESVVWKRVTSWIGESLALTARELTQTITQKTIEFTKSALEQLGPQPEKKIFVFEESEEDDELYEQEDEKLFELTEEFESVEEVDDVNDVEMISPKRMKIDSEPLVTIEPVQQDSLPVASFEVLPKVSVVVEARLTEIVLFFARCTSNTPLPTIYEHLDEFFRLKGDVALNPTELSLVHNVVKEHLLKDSNASLTPLIPPAQISREVSEEGRKMADIMATAAVLNDSPSKSIRLPASGVRFRAPTFSAEEEARIDAILDSRKQKQKQNEAKALSSTGVRSRLQRKLLDLDRTIEIFESIPTVVDNRDSIQAAINSIINEKVILEKDCAEILSFLISFF